MHDECCVCMTVYMNTSQDDRVFENAKLLFRRDCVSPDWGVAKQQYRLRCNTLPQEMKTMGLLYCGTFGHVFQFCYCVCPNIPWRPPKPSNKPFFCHDCFSPNVPLLSSLVNQFSSCSPRTFALGDLHRW